MCFAHVAIDSSFGERWMEFYIERVTSIWFFVDCSALIEFAFLAFAIISVIINICDVDGVKNHGSCETGVCWLRVYGAKSSYPQLFAYFGM